MTTTLMTKREADDELTGMELLNRTAHRNTAEIEAADVVSDARTRLIAGRTGGQTFLARLALNLDTVANWDIETTATDGRSLHYNPDYIQSLDIAELIGVICQNCLHCALHHITRKGYRDQSRWDIAADLSVDQSILNSGLKLPHDVPIPGQGQYQSLPPDLSAEEYYDLLPKDEDGDGDGDGGCSVSLDAAGAGDGNEAAKSEMEAKWNQNTASAEAAARQRGDMPGDFDRFCVEILEPKVDWREQLREFVNERARNDFTWANPNRRFIWQGIILPGLLSEEVGKVAISIDTSGSISDDDLSRFASEAQGILETYNCELVIIYHHHTVYNEQTWNATDGELELEQTVSGGTSHRGVFQHIEDMDEPPTALICFTDAYTDFPDDAPDYPVLWAIIQNDQPNIPFGEVIQVDL